ncbi:MAG: DoxX family membrane protein [Nitriliruptorales bacterium]
MSDTSGLIFLLGRIVFVIQFLAGAFGHFKMGDQMAGYARQMGAPLPALGGWPAGAWLLVSSLSVLLGVWPDIGMLMIALWGIPTAYWIHGWWRYDDAQTAQNQQLLFMRNLAFLGGAVIAFALFVHLGDQLRYVITPPAFSF